MTRAQRAAAGGTNPTPPSVIDSPVTVISPDSDGKSNELYDSDATESEAELPEESYVDEETRLRLEESRLDEQLREIQTIAIRRRVEAKQKALAAARAELEAGTDVPIPPVMESQAALPVVVTETPVRYNLRPRILTFQSTVGRKPPTAAAVLYKAGVDGLPDVAVPVPVPLPVPKAAVAEVPLPVKGKASHILVKPVQPEKFTGDDATQNERVERWILAVSSWLRLAEVPGGQHLDWARSLIASTGGASVWLAQKDDELEHLGKVMTWEWLQGQLIQHYGQPSGALAMAAEWEVMRMGVKNADGSDTGGKSTYTVAAYTTLFMHYMRALTSHSVVTADLLVINRYVAGIRLGWEPLYKVMLGVQKVLWYDTLQEAIEAAYQGEAALNVSKIERRSATASTPSSGSNFNRFRGGKRQTENNNIEDSTGGEGREGNTAGAASPSTPSTSVEPTRVFGFVYRGPGPADGRFPCKEAQQKLLYDRHQCY